MEPYRFQPRMLGSPMYAKSKMDAEKAKNYMRKVRIERTTLRTGISRATIAPPPRKQSKSKFSQWNISPAAVQNILVLRTAR